MIENRMRLERQIYLGRQAAKRARQGPSGHVFNDPVPPASAGQQSSMARTTTFLAEDSDDDDFDTRTLDAPEGWTAPAQPVDARPSSSNNGSLISRLRAQSFPGLAAHMRPRSRLFAQEGVERQPETSGNSDSSAEEEFQRPAYHPGVLRNRPDVRQVFRGDGADGDQEDDDF